MYSLETIIRMNEEAQAKWELRQREELRNLLKQILTQDCRTLSEVLQEDARLAEKMKEVLHG